MKAKITNHEIREVDGSIILYMQYHYKGVDSTVSIIDLQDRIEWHKLPAPKWKELKQFLKTAELAINQELREKADNENKFKKELKVKQKELDKMREFVNSRWHNHESVKSALQEYKQLKNVSKENILA